MQPSRPGSGASGTVVLDREFRAATLSALREEVLVSALAAGLSRDRSIDVLLAAHELAANIIRHGSGRGRMRMRVTARALSCQVSDARAVAGPGFGGQRQADGTANAPGPAAPSATAPTATAPAPAAWPVEHGHGLWLVRRTADQVQVTAGPAGSVVSMTFNLPAATLPTA
jgi:anti-sigma regulatory factor (Ser/Thr protein kinase)